MGEDAPKKGEKAFSQGSTNSKANTKVVTV